MRYADATPTDLIRDMADIHVHIKLKVFQGCFNVPTSKSRENMRSINIMLNIWFVQLFRRRQTLHVTVAAEHALNFCVII